MGAGAAALGACDTGDRTDRATAGPAVHIVWTNTATGVPADGAIELRFDRLLLPSSVSRQSVSLRTAGNAAVEPVPVVVYDPVLRAVRLENPNADGAPWLTPNVPYKVVLGLPVADASEAFVLRSIDGAAVDPAAPIAGSSLKVPEVAFSTTAPSFAARRPDISFCRDVASVFDKYCTSCHGAAARPYEALLLDTPAGLVRTAFGHVAEETNRGARAGTPEAPGAIFGEGMPIVDPGSPGNSSLVYKMLLLAEGDHAGFACAGRGDPTVVTDGGAFLPDDERARLANLMLGQPMPPLPPYPTLDDVERVSQWIVQGAPVAACGACTPAADAGAD